MTKLPEKIDLTKLSTGELTYNLGKNDMHAQWMRLIESGKIVVVPEREAIIAEIKPRVPQYYQKQTKLEKIADAILSLLKEKKP